MNAYFYSQFFYFISLIFVSVHFGYENILIKWSLKSFILYNLAICFYLVLAYFVNRNKSITLFIYFVFIYCPVTMLSLDSDGFFNIFVMILIFPVVFLLVDKIKFKIINGFQSSSVSNQRK
mgnify:CR=1 FL=1